MPLEEKNYIGRLLGVDPDSGLDVYSADQLLRDALVEVYPQSPLSATAIISKHVDASSISVGDAVFSEIDFSGIRPASDEPWVTGLADTQANFVNHFLGIVTNVSAGITDEWQGVQGSGTLTFDGQTTASIATTDSAADVQAKLEALSTIGSGNVLVEKESNGNWTVKFIGSLGGTNVSQMTGMTVSTIQQGGQQLYEVEYGPMTVFVMNCVSATYEIGDMLGMAKQAGNFLENNKLVRVAVPYNDPFDKASVCFRCVKREPTAVTTVKVIMQSARWGVNDVGRQ